jgi:hypothetical protein
MGWFDRIAQWFRGAKKAFKLVEQLETIDTERRNLELQIELAKTKEALARKQSVKFVSPYCFQENDPEPLCPVCWETKQLLVHLSPLEDWSGGKRRDCPSCNWSHFEEPMDSRPIPMRRSRFRQR